MDHKNFKKKASYDLLATAAAISKFEESNDEAPCPCPDCRFDRMEANIQHLQTDLAFIVNLIASSQDEA